MREQLFIDNTEIPLQKSLNPSLTYSVADISQPDKRKSTYSKTIKIPNSKIAAKLFGGLFDVNLVDSSFDISKRVDMYYLVDGELIMEGYCQLKNIEVTDNNDINYSVVLFGNTANLFSKLKGLYLDDVVDLSIYDHPLVKEAIEQSWDFQILENGVTVPFELGKGYIYPLIDYGYNSNSLDFQVGQLSPAIYVKEYWDRVFSNFNYTYTSTFLDSDLFKSLIIPSDPSIYSLTEQEIIDRQFSVNTPIFFDTGNTQSLPIPENSDATNEVIVMTNDVTDPSGLYNNTTGEYTVTQNGVYNLNTIVDIDATFVPNDLLENLSVSSEIRGYLKIIKNGTTTLDMVDFYISPFGLAVGARDTITPPASGFATHRQTASGGLAGISAGRTQTPINRYQLNVNNVNLLSGDVLTVEFAGVWVAFGAMFQNILGVNYDGTCYLNISVGGFSNIVVNQTIGYNTTFDLNRAIPNKYLATDFLKDIIKMFNLQVQSDPLVTNNFIIEPYDDYYLSDNINDWSEKHAINKPHTITPVGKQKNLNYSFSYKADKDYYNDTYLNQWQEVYGYREVTALNDFLKGTYKTELTLSPTPIVGDPNAEIVIPRIIKLDDQDQPVPTKFNRRILFYGGLKGNPAGGVLLTPWTLDWSTAVVPQNNYEYPYCGHFDDPFNPTLDINFGLVKEVYYDDNIEPITVTDANLYNVYYSNMIDGILDPNGKIFEGYFHLVPTDIYTLSFRDLFYHNNSYWRLMKISNYNPSDVSLVKCQFQKARTLTPFESSIIPSYGSDEVIEKSGTIVDNSEQLPVKNKSQQMQKDGNSFNNNTTKISGSNNYVNRTSIDIEILGDDNTVSANTRNIRLINSNDNLINAGVYDVTLINTDGLTIDESNVTYIDGVKVADPSGGGSKAVIDVNTSQTVTIDFRTYLVDTSAGDVTITLPVSQNDGRQWNIKKTDKNNKLIVTSTDLIDGQLTKTIKSVNTSMSVVYDADNTTYKII